MLELADLQRQFAASILNPAVSVPISVLGPDGAGSDRRFSVYRNNVIIGLIDCLRASYPVVEQIVGADFFHAMCRQFVVVNPPTSPIMLHYGNGLAEFIENFSPCSSVPYLADVARLERAWLQSYHAADARPLAGSDLAELDEALLPKIILAIHPAIRCLTSRYPSHRIWQMNIDGQISPIELADEAEEILVCRPETEVSVHQVPRGTVTFLNALRSRETVERAALAAWSQNSAFELGKVLGGLIQCGAFSQWQLSEQHSPEKHEVDSHDL